MPTKEFVRGLLIKRPENRLGCTIQGDVRSNQAIIKAHPFFAGLDWVKLEARQVPPPFKPNGRAQRAAPTANFDDEFTAMAPRITPVGATLRGMQPNCLGLLP